MKKATLCLIFGGKSREYDVSLISAECIINNLNTDKYDLYLLGITREGEWCIYMGDRRKIGTGEWERETEKYPVAFCQGKGVIRYGESYEHILRPDVVLPMVHGDYGEDGRIKCLFDIIGLKCAGIGADGAALTVNKYITKLIAREMSVPVADFYIIRESDIRDEGRIYGMGDELEYPLFVKASSCGSSVGVYKVKKREELIPAVKESLGFSSAVLLEKEVKGKETEIGVIEKNGNIHLGKIGQIDYVGEFYDYDAKYKNGDSVCVIPAKISEKCEKTVREYAKRLFVGAQCRGFCRMDFFVTEDETVIFNEINTIPGFTSGSMFPMLMDDGTRGIGGIIDDMLTWELQSNKI